MVERLSNKWDGVPELAEKAKGLEAPVLPELVIHKSDVAGTASKLAKVLSSGDRLYERGGRVVRIIVRDGVLTTQSLTRNSVVSEAARLCRTMAWTREKVPTLVPESLPDRVALLYLDMTPEERNLPPLNGIATIPLLKADGSIRFAEGYDAETGLWCCSMPQLNVPARPTRKEAEDALYLLRFAFRTFPWADAEMVPDPDGKLNVKVVDLGQNPGRDESAFLMGLLTAACRQSLPLSVLLVFTSPKGGSGNGKGRVVRAIAVICYNCHANAFTPGRTVEEMEKRIGTMLMGSEPIVFVDNVNDTALKSDMVASIATENPCRVRLLGRSEMPLINSKALMVFTGNGLIITEDLSRRFIHIELDSKMESPELRDFGDTDFLDVIKEKRVELLSAALTIWRWGRQNTGTLTKGRKLGSYEIWGEWVRDPLLTLGCLDPVERMEQDKKNDAERQLIVKLYTTWWKIYESEPVKASELESEILDIIDPQRRGHQFVAPFLIKLVGYRIAGFVLSQQRGLGPRSDASTYALKPTDEGPVVEEGASQQSYGTMRREEVRRRAKPRRD